VVVDEEEDGFEELEDIEGRVGVGGGTGLLGEAVGGLVGAAFGGLVGLVLAFALAHCVQVSA
jgi:hypothetical protein